MITIELPKALCSAAGQPSVITLDDSHKSVGEAIAALREKSPRAVDSVLDERGNVRRHINVFLNGESIRYLNGLDTPAPSGSAILIITAISGG
ncbi:MAG: MoaD/ThiS family protein [Gemmatimonadota bacterium]|nr:MoaD/ThiS family protein [Gemmatimonadota bacterium]